MHGYRNAVVQKKGDVLMPVKMNGDLFRTNSDEAARMDDRHRAIIRLSQAPKS